MESPPSNTKNNAPEPETLQAHGSHSANDGAADKSHTPTPLRHRLRTYRPSHKATFIGIAVVVAILAVNVAVIVFILRPQSTAGKNDKSIVSISTDTLSKLGVNRDSIGSSGAVLTINPDSQFNGNVTVGNDVSVAGQLKLNGPFSAASATLAKLQAGDTAVNSLNVNGDGTVTTLNLRKDLNVAGSTHFSGPVTSNQLVTVNNNLNVSGNLSLGGTLSARGFEAQSVAADNLLTVGGHISTRGSAPGVGPGSGDGANGTVSISGNDAAGTVAVNAGTGAGNGLLAQVSFRSAYSSTPHVVITSIGAGVPGVYVNRTAFGFSIGVSGALSPGGYAFDYIVMQ